MDAPDRMVPVGLGEPLLLVVPEGGIEESPDLDDLGRGQLDRAQPTESHPASLLSVLRPIPSIVATYL